jgi:hypothetical protein
MLASTTHFQAAFRFGLRGCGMTPWSSVRSSPAQSSDLSLESLYSEAGWFSQIPSRLTAMTTGRSQTFDTPWGVIEFVHTACRSDRLAGGVRFDERRKRHVATPERAWHDLKRVGRNQNLVTPLEGGHPVIPTGPLGRR